MTYEHTRKVMAIGLDSATPQLIEPWVKQGKLPVFRQLMENGCYSRLNSTVPALTPPAWTTALTGVNPGKHNVFDFFRIGPENQKQMVNSSDRKSKALWQILDEKGLRSIIVNLPLTYPVQEFNGVMVAGMPVPSICKGFVAPEHRLEEVLEKTGGRQLGVDVHPLLKGDEQEFLEDLARVTRRITGLTRHLMDTDPWDFLMVVFDDLDRIQHTFWHYMDSDHPLYDKDKAACFENAILDFYQVLEEQIKELTAAAGENTLVIVFSDHGMGPVYRNFYINRFFMAQGWLKIKQSMVDPKEILRRLGLSQERLRLFLGATGLRNAARKLLPAGVKDYVKKQFPCEALEMEFFDWAGILNWEETCAYLCSRTGLGVIINKALVKDYEAFADKVIEALLALKDPQTGRCPVSAVYKGSQVYKGPFARKAPDLVIEPAPGIELQEKMGATVFEDVCPSRVTVSANHLNSGVFWASCPGAVSAGLALDEVNMADIAPTILYYMGIPVPEQMDGQVVTKMFDPSFCREHPLTYDKYDLSTDNAGSALSRQEASIIAERLKDLGYME